MKGFNVVLAVLIFILALTSAVFSFFLFEKRARLVYGYGTLGENIEKIARTEKTYPRKYAQILKKPL